MKKNVFGRKFKRDKNERKALFKSLMSALVMRERIEISEAKAKAIRPEIEKLITKAKKGGNAAKLVIEKSLTREAFDRIIKEIAPRFTKRQGGYTRLIKLGERFGDNSPVVVMEWTETEIQNSEVKIQNDEEKKPVRKEIKPVKKVTKKALVKKVPAKTKKSK